MEKTSGYYIGNCIVRLLWTASTPKEQQEVAEAIGYAIGAFADDGTERLHAELRAMVDRLEKNARKNP